MTYPFYIFIGGIILSIISYFLKKSLEEIKELRQITTENRNDLMVLKTDYLNKYQHLSEKFDILCDSVKDLTKEIKELNKELNRKNA